MNQLAMRTLTAAAILAISAGAGGMRADTGASLVDPEGSSKFERGKAIVLRSDQVHEGDLYAVAQAAIDIEGTVDGDLFGAAAEISVRGTVAGDTFLGGSIVDMSGSFGDSARVFASSYRLNGTVEGDLLVFGGNIILGEDSHVTGDVVVAAGHLRAAGRIDGDVSFGGGEVLLLGSIGGGFEGRADLVKVDENASIVGDLKYRAREEATVPDGVVGGKVSYEPRAKSDDKNERAFLTGSDALRSALQMLWAFILGSVGLALFPAATRVIGEHVGREPLLNLGIGFVLLFVVPISSVVAMALVVTIPLSISVLLLYVIAAYAAKLPVALALGRWLLVRAGRPEPSAYLALLIGLIPLYAGFLVLSAWSGLIWAIAWGAVSMLGLGAIASGLRARAAESPATAPSAN
jgi:cytoskeletal protein CcmA (bactofilin family)